MGQPLISSTIRFLATISAFMACIASATILPSHAETPANTVVIAGGIDATVLDALDTWATSPDRSLIDHITDSLMRWTTPGKLTPWLAQSWRLVDPLTWEFTLRKGVKFQDDEPMDASSFKLFFDTILDPATKSPQRGEWSFIHEVQIVDDYTFRIITNRPTPAALPTFLDAIPIPPKYFQSVGLDGFRAKPIGTGPYRMTERIRDDHTTFEAWDGYWGGPQVWKKIIYRPIPEAAARVSALLAGEIDLALDVPPELKPIIARSSNLQVKTATSPRFYFLQLSNQHENYPTSNEMVREAISYGIDRQSLAQDVLSGAGSASSWVSKGSFGENPDLKPLPYDPQRSRELLAKAGYPNGLDIDMDAPSGRYLKDKEMAEAIVGQLSKAGIRVNLHILDYAVLSKRIFSHEVDPISLLAWGNAELDPDNFNRSVLDSKGPFAQFSDPELDKILNAASVEMDSQKRQQDLFEQQDYQLKEYPIVYVDQIGEIAGVSKKLFDWPLRSDERFYFYRNNVVQ